MKKMGFLHSKNEARMSKKMQNGQKSCFEVLSHSSFNLVAELGGYLGLTLGLSLMHLELPIKMIWHQIMVWEITGKVCLQCNNEDMA